MKTLAFISTILITVSANAQWKADRVSFGTGKDPLSSGINGSVTLSDSSGNSLLVGFNPLQGEFLWFHSVAKGVSFGPTVGFFKNVPWFGPVFNADLFEGHLNFFIWYGWSAGDCELGNTSAKVRFAFNYDQITFSVHSWSVYYALLNYEKFLPENIVGVSKSFSLTNHLSTYVGVGFIYVRDDGGFSDVNNFLYSSGIKYSF